MKKVFFYTMVMILLQGILLTSCEGSEKKLEDAKDNVQEAKRDLNDAKKAAAADAIKTANEAEWKVFSNAAGFKIKNFENRIEELKEKLKLSGDQMYKTTNRQLDTLEMRNKELKQRIGNYEENKSDWESFKTNYYNDTRALDEDLKNFTTKKK